MQELALGRYKSEEEVLSEAVQLLSQRNALRDEIAAGTRQLAAGEYTDYDSESTPPLDQPQQVFQCPTGHLMVLSVSPIWRTLILTESAITSRVTIPCAANNTLDTLFDALETLARNPELGERRQDLGENLRAFVVRPHVIFYYPAADGIHVARVIHGSRDFPSMFR